VEGTPVDLRVSESRAAWIGAKQGFKGASLAFDCIE